MEDLKDKEDLKEQVEKLKLEVEKAKKDIQDTYIKFETHKFVDSHTKSNSIWSSSIFYITKCRIKLEFIKFLKNNPGYLSKIYIKKLQKLELNGRKYYTSENINPYKKYYEKEIIEQFKEALEILDKYSNEYEKQQLTEELCKYTDCLEKLTPTKTCKQCHSEYPKEAKFCPACGCELYKPIIDNSKLQSSTPITGTYSNPKYFYATWVPEYYQDKTTDPKGEKVQEDVEPNSFRKLKCSYSEECSEYKENFVKCNWFNYTTGKDERELCMRNFRKKKEEKVLCNSCLDYGECDHPNLTECSQYKSSKKEKKEDTRINKCPYYEHCNCYCNIREYEKCTFYIEYKQKETKKESPQCPYATTKCSGYIESLCKDYKDYKECVGYRTLKEEEETKKKCPYFDKCPNTNKNNAITYCYTGHMAQVELCERYIQFEKENKSCVNCSNLRTKCGYYHNLYTNLCDKLKFKPIHMKSCSGFERQKNRCKYYNQCPYYSKDSNLCIFIEDKEANMGCAQHYEFRKKEAREKGGLMFA